MMDIQMLGKEKALSVIEDYKQKMKELQNKAGELSFSIYEMERTLNQWKAFYYPARKIKQLKKQIRKAKMELRLIHDEMYRCNDEIELMKSEIHFIDNENLWKN